MDLPMPERICATAMLTPRSKLEFRFVCPKCSNKGAAVKTVSMSGGTLSRMFNFQHNRYLAATCEWCGYTEFYDASVLGEKGGTANVFDLLFGG